MRLATLVLVIAACGEGLRIGGGDDPVPVEVVSPGGEGGAYFEEGGTRWYGGCGRDGDGASNDECDLDGDGFCAPSCGGSDCNDRNQTVYPGAAEVCGSGLDEDCSGVDDEGCGGGGGS